MRKLITIVGAAVAMAIAIPGAALAAPGSAGPAEAGPDPHASVAGVASYHYAQQQARNELSQSVLVVRKAGGSPQEYLKGSFSDLLVSSGICSPSVCGVEQ